MKARLPDRPYKITKAERKAIYSEVDKQTGRNVAELSKNLLAAFLWYMRVHEGHGKKKLLEDAKKFAQLVKDLKEFYDFRDGEDMDFLYKYKLKNEVGIDVDELDDLFEFKVVVRE